MSLLQGKILSSSDGRTFLILRVNEECQEMPALEKQTSIKTNEGATDIELQKWFLTSLQQKFSPLKVSHFLKSIEK